MMSKQKSLRKSLNKKTVIVSKNIINMTFLLCVDNKGKRGGRHDYFEEKSYSMQEKEKIIEVLLSQERVLTLLYDRTFPPRANTQPPVNQEASTLSNQGSLRKFNYHGTNGSQIGDP